jgi:O-antigen/teichoic acid export membrane protein
VPVAPERWLRTSVPMGAATMLLAINTQVGLLVLGAIGSPSDAGVYAAAQLCMAPFTLLVTAGRLPLGGVVARLRAAGERRRLQRGLLTATRAVAALSAVLAVVLLVAPSTVLGLFGEDFTSGVDVLRILTLLQLLNTVAPFNGLVLIMGGEERAAMRAALVCLVLNLSLCLALVPALGASGAALAALVAVVVRNVSNSITAWRRLGLDTTILGLEAGSRRPEDFS